MKKRGATSTPTPGNGCFGEERGRFARAPESEAKKEAEGAHSLYTLLQKPQDRAYRVSCCAPETGKGWKPLTPHCSTVRQVIVRMPDGGLQGLLSGQNGYGCFHVCLGQGRVLD